MVEKISKGALKGLAQAAIEAVERETEQLGARRPDAARDSLISRHEAAKRLDNIKMVRRELIDPALCRPSPQNARDYAKLTVENCQDLIDSIRTEGEQHEAAHVRPTGDPDVPYEIVTGSRRHFAVSWLRQNNYSQIQYLIEVRDLTDEAAFRLSDEENRARKDVTDIERARKYAEALQLFYGGSASTMADRIAINEKTLRRYLHLAEVPGVIVDAYGGQEVITVSHARALAPELGKGDQAKQRMLEEAEKIAQEQRALAEDGKPRIAPPAVFARLVRAGKERRGSGASGRAMKITDSRGGELFSYTAPTAKHGLSLKVPSSFAGTKADLLAALTKLIEETY